MPLDDLNTELYSSTTLKVADHEHEKSEYDPLTGQTLQASPFEQEEKWQQAHKGLSPKSKKYLKISLGFLLAIVLAIGATIFYKWWMKNAFHQDRVSITFEGPREADSTQAVKYIVHYKNNNRVTLQNSEINLKYAENFQPTDNLNLKILSATASKIFIGDIKPMSEGSVELKGVFYAPKDAPVFIHGTLNFTPSNATTQLAMDDQIGISITASPVILTVNAPGQVASGDTMEYVIEYKNMDFRRMDGAQVRIDFPEGFVLSSAFPRPSEKDSFWYLGNLEPNQGGKITIRGQLSGQADGDQHLAVALGRVGQDEKFIAFNQQEFNTKIVVPILAIKQELDGKSDNVVSAGEILKYIITYQNTGDIGLRDAIITAQLDSKILDFSKLDTGGGTFDGNTGTITWKAAQVSGLANIPAKGSGTVKFSIPVKTVIPVVNKLDKNFVISGVAKIDSPDIPTPIDSNKVIGSNRLELKLSTKVLFDGRAYYRDAKTKNTGPIPMTAGQETTFTVRWSITNVSNDLKDVQIISSLPAGVRWTGNFLPMSEKITYNERTNQLAVDVGDVPAGMGALGSPREIAFQIGVTPQVNQVGMTMLLLNKTILSGKDAFTNKNISIELPAKDSLLPEDPSVGYINGKVVAQQVGSGFTN